MPESESLFPPAESADRHGIVGVGGDLSPRWLLDAYRNGIFPWPLWDEISEPVWWSPDPRAIFELDHFYVSQRLARRCNSGRFHVTSDRDFAAVMRNCGTAQDRADNTWVTPEMLAAYTQLHQLGHVHSVEVWLGERLVGGTYGVAIGGLFAGESAFYLERDASKVALAHLVAHLRQQGYRLFDIQQLTPHSESLGAIEIPRYEYLDRLQAVVDLPVEFGQITAGRIAPSGGDSPT